MDLKTTIVQSQNRNNRRPTAAGRRQFLASTLAAAAALLAPRSARSADSRIEVLINEPIGTITPDIYGHFIEHLGGVIYDGVWVGENSKIANQAGIRSQLIEYMRRIKPPVVRWPGGCFADSYNWRDGIGPREARSRRTNFWAGSMNNAPNGPQKYDPNHFGTHEFMRFCRLTGSQPYLAANVRSLTPRDFYEWVEYCNAPSGLTSLSDLRSANGDTAPFDVRFWGVGNEPWGCGGNFTPEDYATEYRKFISWVPRYGRMPSFIAAGPNGGSPNGSVDWTRRFFANMVEKGRGQLNNLYGWALHYYCGTVGKRQSIDFTLEDWYELLNRADRMEALVEQHWLAMGEADPEHRVKLIVDEWGAWHAQSQDVPAAFLFGYLPTLRDALIAALTLDTFNRHADKIVMANVAQLINTIHSLFVAHEDRFVATPNFHVFEMYAAHQGAQAVRTVISAPRVSYQRAEKPASLWGLAGSASLQGKTLLLTLVNPHASESRDTEISVAGASLRSCQIQTLSASDIHAHNSFANPTALIPTSADLAVNGKTAIHRFAPASVTRLQFTLA
jgi:alpha-N-arabinofuranosidase